MTAAVIAVMAGIWMWSQTPDYRVLFSNFSDRDGGAIVAALEQQNVPYRFAEGGSAILVPADKVHDIRLKLAAQGLPKGSGVGFELMENQKLGISQFLEQVNFQRALEGELARSIQSLAAVQSARVHLAIPKPSVFLREQQKPSASVLVSLYPGRTLDRAQVAGIMHMVSSSVADLPLASVSVLDQNGALLSAGADLVGVTVLDEFAFSLVGQNPHYGTPSNPRAPGRVCGGSSCGSAAMPSRSSSYSAGRPRASCPPTRSGRTEKPWASWTAVPNSQSSCAAILEPEGATMNRASPVFCRAMKTRSPGRAIFIALMAAG